MILLSRAYLLWKVGQYGWTLQDAPHPKHTHTKNPAFSCYCFCFPTVSVNLKWQYDGNQAQRRKTLTSTINLSVSSSLPLQVLHVGVCACVCACVCVCVGGCVVGCVSHIPTHTYTCINACACCLFHFLLVKHIPWGDFFDSVLRHGKLRNKQASRVIQTLLWARKGKKNHTERTIGYTKWYLVHGRWNRFFYHRKGGCCMLLHRAKPPLKQSTSSLRGCVRNGKRGDYATRTVDHRQIHSRLFQDQCSTHFNWREKKNTGGRKILRENHQGHFYVDLSW